MTRPFIKAGPVYVDGRLVFTATRDIYSGEPMRWADVILPGGISPKSGAVVPDEIARIARRDLAFTQDNP